MREIENYATMARLQHNGGRCEYHRKSCLGQGERESGENERNQESEDKKVRENGRSGRVQTGNEPVSNLSTPALITDTRKRKRNMCK